MKVPFNKKHPLVQVAPPETLSGPRSTSQSTILDEERLNMKVFFNKTDSSLSATNIRNAFFMYSVSVGSLTRCTATWRDSLRCTMVLNIQKL